MLKFQLVCLFAVLAVINVKSISGLKCDFQFIDDEGEDDVVGEYYCNVVAYPNYKETHKPSKTDNDVKSMWLPDNQGVTHFTQADFHYCQQFPNLYKADKAGLETIDENGYRNCKALTKINIFGGKLRELPENLFADNTMLTKLQIKNNKLTTLPENIFSNNKELVTLNLKDNKITTFPSNTFKSLTKLTSLFLEENKIESLEAAWFENMRNLETLDLHENQISDLPKNVFASLVNLKKLYFNENRITVIHADSFGPSKMLTSFDFRENRINAIDEKLFDVISSRFYSLLENECVHRNFPAKEDVRRILKRCFQNYQPRA